MLDARFSMRAGCRPCCCRRRAQRQRERGERLGRHGLANKVLHGQGKVNKCWVVAGARQDPGIMWLVCAWGPFCPTALALPKAGDRLLMGLPPPSDPRAELHFRCQNRGWWLAGQAKQGLRADAKRKGSYANRGGWLRASPPRSPRLSGTERPCRGVCFSLELDLGDPHILDARTIQPFWMWISRNCLDCQC